MIRLGESFVSQAGLSSRSSGSVIGSSLNREPLQSETAASGLRSETSWDSSSRTLKRRMNWSSLFSARFNSIGLKRHLQHRRDLQPSVQVCE